MANINDVMAVFFGRGESESISDAMRRVLGPSGNLADLVASSVFDNLGTDALVVYFSVKTGVGTFLVTEVGDLLMTEAGDFLVTE